MRNEKYPFCFADCDKIHEILPNKCLRWSNLPKESLRDQIYWKPTKSMIFALLSLLLLLFVV